MASKIENLWHIRHDLGPKFPNQSFSRERRNSWYFPDQLLNLKPAKNESEMLHKTTQTEKSVFVKSKRLYNQSDYLKNLYQPLAGHKLGNQSIDATKITQNWIQVPLIGVPEKHLLNQWVEKFVNK